MGFTSAIRIGSLVALAGAATAQAIQVASNPVQAGVPFAVTLTNTSASGLPVSEQPSLALLRATGELIVPEIVGCSSVGSSLPPGATALLSFATPAAGAGAEGSFVLLYPYGNGAVDRVDVGAPDPGFPDLHAYPASTPFNAQGHHVSFPPNQVPDWEIANTGSASHTLPAGSLDLFTPGGTVPVASLGLAGITVPAGRVTRIALPLGGLAPGPYTVRMQWVDPGTGAPMTVTHGIEAAAGAFVDLHFPGGKLVPPGGSVPARLTMNGFFPPFDPLGVPQGPLPFYVLVLGFRPGTTTLGGAVVPVANDGLVRRSLHGLHGVLTNNIGVTVPLTTFCAHRVFGFPAASGIEIRHPNSPSISGLTLRAAAVGLDAQGTFGASQPEEITFQ